MSSNELLIEAMRKYHEGRQSGGLKRKYRCMAEGAFEFFRGTNFLFARAWPELQPRWPGPAVWLCGDLHLENFGAFPTDDGDFRFDINDFDESVVAMCSLDLVRCSTSILLAAESWHLSPTQGTGMVLSFLDAYRSTLLDDSFGGPKDAQPNFSAVATLLDAVRLGSRDTMLQRYAERWRDGKWWFRKNDARVKGVSDETREEVARTITEFGKSKGWQVLDVVKRYSGIGSLGLRRYQVLVQASGSSAPELYSLKEAASSVLAPFVDAAQPAFPNEAARIVTGQSLLQGNPTAGLAAVEVGGRSYRLRAMIPDENRSSLNRLQQKPKRLRQAVALAGELTARSQRRGSRLAGEDRFSGLTSWVETPALDAVLAAAVRFADWVTRDYGEYLKAFQEGSFES